MPPLSPAHLAWTLRLRATLLTGEASEAPGTAYLLREAARTIDALRPSEVPWLVRVWRTVRRK